MAQVRELAELLEGVRPLKQRLKLAVPVPYRDRLRVWNVILDAVFHIVASRAQEEEEEKYALFNLLLLIASRYQSAFCTRLCRMLNHSL
jgi:hypothetical protein